jgi:hypothetical protein
VLIGARVGPGQVAHIAPQLAGSVLERQVPFAVFLQKFVLQAVPQTPAAQTACAFAGGLVGHATHVPFPPVPHRVMLLFGWQVPVTRSPQRWVPAAHMDISQTDALLHVVPVGQAVQETLSTVPQVASASSRTQTLLHMWKPFAQV